MLWGNNVDMEVEYTAISYSSKSTKSLPSLGIASIHAVTLSCSTPVSAFFKKREFVKNVGEYLGGDVIHMVEFGVKSITVLQEFVEIIRRNRVGRLEEEQQLLRQLSSGAWPF